MNYSFIPYLIIIAQIFVMLYLLFSNKKNDKYNKVYKDLLSLEVNTLRQKLKDKQQIIELHEQKIKYLKILIHEVRSENVRIKYFHNLYRKKLIQDFDYLIILIENARKSLTSTKDKDFKKKKEKLIKEKSDKINDFSFRLSEFKFKKD